MSARVEVRYRGHRAGFGPVLFGDGAQMALEVAQLWRRPGAGAMLPKWWWNGPVPLPFVLMFAVPAVPVEDR